VKVVYQFTMAPQKFRANLKFLDQIEHCLMHRKSLAAQKWQIVSVY